MKFSIQEEGKEKQIFFSFQKASEETGIPTLNIHYVLNKNKKPVYRRRKDGVKFTIKKEETPFAKIDGKDYFTMNEIEEDFGITRTLFINQLAKKKNHFLDRNEISHNVEKSEDLKVYLDKFAQLRMCSKVMRKTNSRAHWVDQNGKICPGFLYL